MKNKLRADKFVVIPSRKTLMRIQGEFQKNWSVEREFDTLEDVNKLLLLYARIALDEGYRQAISELREAFKSVKPLKPLKKRKKGFAIYVEEEDVKEAVELAKKRINSKRQRKARAKYCAEIGIEDHEESFVLSMAITTAYEIGYIKGSSIETMASHAVENPERADLAVRLFKELFQGYQDEQ